MTGDLKTFGLSHARSVMGGAMHYLKEIINENPNNYEDYFAFTFYDTGEEGGQFVKDRDKLEADFIKAQENCDIVFGPMSSELSKELFIVRKINISKSTIITIASTPTIRSHSKYGSTLFQFSNNINSYSKQIVNFFADFSIPKPTDIYCIHRQDEYGISSRNALNISSNEKGINFSYRTIPQNYFENKHIIENDTLLWKKINENSDKTVIALIAVGDVLTSLVDIVKTKAPDSKVTTLTSVERDKIKSGQFEDVFLIYSYVPGAVNLQTLQFYQHINNANIYLKEILGHKLAPKEWHKPNTVDAEVHDAVIFVMSKFFEASFDDRHIKSELQQSLYVTNFMITGSGKEIGNEGSLYIFQVKNSEMLPVKNNFW